MSDGGHSTDPIEQFLTQLREEIAEHEAVIEERQVKVADLRNAIAVIVARRAIVAASDAAQSTALPPDEAADSDKDWQKLSEDTLQKLCYGKGIADAGIAVLAAVGHQISESQLTAALQSGGVVFVGANPVNSFRFAMMRKQQETGMVTEVSQKVWGLASWPEAVNPNSTGFIAHRSKADHMQASLRGLQEAKKRGVRLGRQPIITEQHAPKIQAMLDKRIPVKQIAKEFNVSAPGMTKVIARLRSQGHLLRKGQAG